MNICEYCKSKYEPDLLIDNNRIEKKERFCSIECEQKMDFIVENGTGFTGDIVYPEKTLNAFENRLEREFTFGMVPRSQIPRLVKTFFKQQVLFINTDKIKPIQEPFEQDGETHYYAQAVVSYMRRLMRYSKKYKNLAIRQKPRL